MTARPGTVAFETQTASISELLYKKINGEKDEIHFKTRSPAYKNMLSYVELLCEKICGTREKFINHKYAMKNQVFKDCAQLFVKLEELCDRTDLNKTTGSTTLRFGHVAFKDWFDGMKSMCKDFVDNTLAKNCDQYLREELFVYISESFGNRTRIDYGTGHELSFIIFTMGLMFLVELDQLGGKTMLTQRGDTAAITPELLKVFVDQHGWDIHALFAHRYLRLCRRLQTKFRLEPAGSRGVYNMDDFQFLPFLFGAAQLSGVKFISTTDFYLPDQVDMFKHDYIFFEAVDFTLNNKKGPFNEHSYTLWGFTSIGTWDGIYRRIKMKFKDNILGPFPIVQHFLFGKYILKWDNEVSNVS